MNFVPDGADGGFFSPTMGQPATTEKGEEIVRQCDVTVHDVLLGRGRGPNMHPGNQRYREIIYANRDNYNQASNRTEQTRITREIVNHIKLNGRFLKRLEAPKAEKKKKKRGESNGDYWVVVSDATARLKVGQCLRYKLRQDAEQNEDGSLDEFQVEQHSAKNKYAGGAVLPQAEPSAQLVEPDREAAFATQPSRKLRKVEFPEEPPLNAEEFKVLKSLGRPALGTSEEDSDLDGFVESPLWEAKADTHLLPQEREQDYTTALAENYYDTMLGNSDAYDSNYAYGSDLISDAEVLSALGYPQPPPQPSRSRSPVLCYCGCRMNASECRKHRHDSVPKNGIFSMPGAVPLGPAGTLRRRSDAAMADFYENTFCSITSDSPEQSSSTPTNSLDFATAMAGGYSATPAMTPMLSNQSAWDYSMQPIPLMQTAPMQTAPVQAIPTTGGMAPFQVPDMAPVARPRMYRPVIDNMT